MALRPSTGLRQHGLRMSAPAVARLSSPGEIVAVLPSLCGFRPDESLVLLSLRGARKRLGLTVRVDLPSEPDDVAVAELCLDRMAADGADAVVVVVFSQRGPRPGLVAAVSTACATRCLDVLEALHVDGEVWTSYTCTGACCPPTGSPVPVAPPVLDLVRAEQAASGRSLLTSREELVRSVAPPTLLAAARAGQRLDEAQRAERRCRRERGAAAARSRTLEQAERLLDRVAEGGAVTPEEAAALTVGLADVAARDDLATRLLTRSDELLSLLLQVAREVTPPHDAPVCALLAWTAYGRGDGALANVALDRALAGSPDDSLALLLRQCLDAGVPPDELRWLAGATGRALRGRRVARARRPR